MDVNATCADRVFPATDARLVAMQDLATSSLPSPLPSSDAALDGASSMPSPSTSHVRDGAQTRRMVRTAAASQWQLASSCLGPEGGVKILVSSPSGGDVTATTSSARLFGGSNLQATSPVAKLLVQLATAQVRRFGDGGLGAVALTSRLVGRIMDDVPSAPRHLVVRALALAREWTRAFLDSPETPCHVPFRWHNLAAASAVVASVVGTKPVCDLRKRELRLVVTLVLRAFLASLSGGGGDGQDDEDDDERIVPKIRHQRVLGPPVQESCVLPAAVLLDLPLPPTARRVWRETQGSGGCRVALYDVSLRMPEPKAFTPRFESSTASATSSTGLAEIQELQRIADSLAAAGIGLVASQRLIPAWLKNALIARGIVPLERLSLRHIAAVRCVSGAAVQSTWTARVDAHKTGAIAALRPVQWGRKEFLQLTACDTSSAPSPASLRTSLAWRKRVRPVATLVLCCPDETALDELAAVVESSVTVLKALLVRPVVVPGGGCVELLVAAHLRRRAATLLGQRAAAAAAAAATTTRQRRRDAGGTGKDGAPDVNVVAGRRRRTAADLDRIKVRLVVNAVADSLDDVAASLSHQQGRPGCGRAEVRARLVEANADALRRCHISGSRHSDSKGGGKRAAGADATASITSASPVTTTTFWGWGCDAAAPVVVLQRRSLGSEDKAGGADGDEALCLSPTVVDALPVKLSMLASAFQTASQLLQIDGIIEDRR